MAIEYLPAESVIEFVHLQLLSEEVRGNKCDVVVSIQISHKLHGSSTYSEGLYCDQGLPLSSLQLLVEKMACYINLYMKFILNSPIIPSSSFLGGAKDNFLS